MGSVVPAGARQMPPDTLGEGAVISATEGMITGAVIALFSLWCWGPRLPRYPPGGGPHIAGQVHIGKLSAGGVTRSTVTTVVC